MTEVDENIASIGLPHHPPPFVLIATLRETVDDLERHLPAAIRMTHLLAAQGWPTGTMGDGGARSTDSTSGPERAVLGDYIDRGAGGDVRLAQALQDMTKAVALVRKLVANAVHHARDLDPVPAGTGECQACGRFCRPDQARPGNRLRSGLCPTDYRAMNRAAPPSRQDWITARRQALTDPAGILHTPEPDHDLDLTSDLAVTTLEGP